MKKKEKIKELEAELYESRMRVNQLLDEREHLLREASVYESFALSGCGLPGVLLSVSRVLTFGRKKYPDNDWQEMSSRTHVDAALRHIGRSSDLGADEESDELHYAHAIARLMMAAAVELGGEYESD